MNNKEMLNNLKQIFGNSEQLKKPKKELTPNKQPSLYTTPIVTNYNPATGELTLQHGNIKKTK